MNNIETQNVDQHKEIIEPTYEKNTPKLSRKRKHANENHYPEFNERSLLSNTSSISCSSKLSKSV